MANQEQLGILRQGTDVWNNWRRENLNVKIDLSAARIVELNLIGINLANAYLHRVNIPRR